jgi:hypothetical protein
MYPSLWKKLKPSGSLLNEEATAVMAATNDPPRRQQKGAVDEDGAAAHNDTHAVVGVAHNKCTAGDRRI